MNLIQDKCVFNTIQNALKRARTAALKLWGVYHP